MNADKDKYFRILADAVVDGTRLTDLLLDSGYAYAYYGGTKRKVDWCGFESERLPASGRKRRLKSSI